MTTALLSTELQNRGLVFPTDAPYSAAGDDATDDTAAFNACLAAERKIYLGGKTYKVTGTLTIALSNTEIVGPGEIHFTNATHATIIYAAGKSGIKLRNFTVRGNASGTTFPATNYGIRLETADDATQFTDTEIEGLDIIDVNGWGISLGGAKRYRIANNRIRNCRGHGIAVANDGTAASAQGVIEGNTLDNIGGAGIIPMGTTHTDVRVTRNFVQDWNSSDYNIAGTSNGDAITCYDDGNLRYVIAENICVNSGKCTGGHGIHAGGSYFTITSNVLYSPKENGIYVREKDQGTVSNYVISGNEIYDPSLGTITDEAGIYIKELDSATVSSNVVSGAAGHGIAYLMGTNVTIEGNTVYTPTGDGIKLGVSSTESVLRGTVLGNTVYTPGGNGINAYNCDQTLIAANNIHEADAGTGNGLNIDQYCAGLTVRTNYFNDSGGQPIVVHASATQVSLEGNTAYVSGVYQPNSNRDQETTTNLQSATHFINTNGKYYGREVYDTTTGKKYFAIGATTTSNWRPMDGGADLTVS